MSLELLLQTCDKAWHHFSISLLGLISLAKKATVNAYRNCIVIHTDVI